MNLMRFIWNPACRRSLPRLRQQPHARPDGSNHIIGYACRRRGCARLCEAGRGWKRGRTTVKGSVQTSGKWTVTIVLPEICDHNCKRKSTLNVMYIKRINHTSPQGGSHPPRMHCCRPLLAAVAPSDALPIASQRDPSAPYHPH